jgi:exopolysaccharide biosynthesis predicted pyruvyltransferase EpsI
MKSSNLKKNIKRKLSKKIDRDYYLLDIPEHKNTGDLFILRGELEFLNNFKFKCKYTTGKTFFDRKKINSKNLILLHGGGNFGDLWIKHQKFRERVIYEFKKNPILIFPQTVYFKYGFNLRRSISIFSEHPNLTICARDKKSYNFLKKHFSKNKILLVPDMAFFINLNKKNLSYKSYNVKKILYICRRDKELTKEYNLDYLKDCDIRDWPSVELNLLYVIENIIFKLINHSLKFLKIKKRATSFIFKKDKNLLKEGINFINKYNLIITNRLHGGIISLMLNKPTIILNNNYNKNKQFYLSWLKKFKNCYFANNQKELKKILMENFKQHIKNEAKK